jgi:hypothetical protein
LHIAIYAVLDEFHIQSNLRGCWIGECTCIAVGWKTDNDDCILNNRKVIQADCTLPTVKGKINDIPGNINPVFEVEPKLTSKGQNMSNLNLLNKPVVKRTSIRMRKAPVTFSKDFL